jgi:Ca2+-transporting ATPase
LRARSTLTSTAGSASTTEATRRLASYGPNRPSRERRPPYLHLALHQLLDPLVGLLVAAAVVSAAIGETTDGIAIAAILVLNASLGFWQEAASRTLCSAH